MYNGQLESFLQGQPMMAPVLHANARRVASKSFLSFTNALANVPVAFLLAAQLMIRLCGDRDFTVPVLYAGAEM